MSEPSATDDPIEGGLGKQRRNVMLTALVLIVYAWAGGRLHNEITLAAMGISFKDPQRIIYLAWAVMAYFTWRYWIYARPAWSAVILAGRDTFNTSTLVRTVLFRNYSRQKRADLQEIADTKQDSNGVMLLTFTVEAIGQTPGRVSYRGGLALLKNGQWDQSKDLIRVQFEVRTLTVVVLWGWSYLKALFTRREYTDYFVPYLLVILAITSWALR